MAGEMTASQERKESLCGWKEMDLQKKTGLGPNRIPGPELGNTGLERKNHGKIQRSFRQIFKTRFEKVNLTQCRQRPRRQWEGVKRLRGREETAQDGLQEPRRRDTQTGWFSGGPVVTDSCVSTAMGPGLILGQGTMILQAVQHGKNKTKTLD